MTDTLRDQLLGLGFKAAPKPEQSRRASPPRADRRPKDARGARSPAAVKPKERSKGGARTEIDLAKAYAIRASREKAERMEAERMKQEEARQRREARAALATLLEGKELNDPAAGIARHFDYGGKIKRVHVTEAQLKALNAGELGVVQVNGRYLLVTAAILAQAQDVFAPAIALKVDPGATPDDDPYADPRFEVPDDLVW